MKITVVNVGSINIDHIYRVPHLVQPGETLASLSMNTVLGGKGANQSVALARAGVGVAHLGRLGKADRWAVDAMTSMGVNTRGVEFVDGPSGHAIIQVDDKGENSIVLHGGANQSFTQDVLQNLFDEFKAADFLLLQNETNLVAEALTLACEAGLKVALNPAPMTPAIKELPLDALELLIVNQVEAESLCSLSGRSPDKASLVSALKQIAPDTQIVLTLGAAGAVLLDGENVIELEAPKVTAIDTTGAGDTFVGYYLAGLVDNMLPAESLARACQAAAIAVTREGATPSIPLLAELDEA